MYPEYAEVNGKKYKINTDFRVAIECNNITQKDDIGNYERALAIIYKLYGQEGLNDFDNHTKLLEIGRRFLLCDKEYEETSNNLEPDMDYSEDMDYIEASFMSDYNIDLSTQTMHWWKFQKLINGLSNSELGNCCILNRIRGIRNYDTKDIKDPKQLAQINELKRQFALKKKQPKIELTDKQKKSRDEFYKLMGWEGSE